VLAALCVIAAVVMAAPAAQAETKVFGDPAGDAIDARGDIVNFGGVYSPDLLTLAATVRSPTNPATDPSWADGVTGVLWDVDVNGDGARDYKVYLVAPNNDPAVEVKTVGDAHACYGDWGYSGGSWFAHLPPGCVGSPPSVRVSAFVAYDTDPYDSAAPVSRDSAPDAGLSAPIASGSSGGTPPPTTTPPTTTPPPAPTPDVTRLAGSGRVETAVAVSHDTFGDGQADAVVIASATNYPDALVGGPLAAARNAPVLLNGRDSLDPTVATEVARLTGGPSAGRTVYLLGGPGALGPAVESQLRSAGYPVTRYGGADRYETAAAVAAAVPSPAVAVEATGTNFPDALAGGAAAARLGGVVVLTAGTTLPAPTKSFLDANPDVRRIAVGGQAAAADPGAAAVVGVDRYDTAVQVAQRYFPNPTVAGIASGENYPDALAGGVHAVHKGGPLLLTPAPSLPANTGGYLHNNAASITHAYVYGGRVAVSDQVATQVQAAI
jgi:hypothetical protein